MAGLPDMQELSPLRAETAKQIAATLGSCVVAEGKNPAIDFTYRHTGKSRRLC
jgi:hypothetical protein